MNIYYSILECYNLFSCVNSNIRSFCFITGRASSNLSAWENSAFTENEFWVKVQWLHKFYS